jgi:hypothetical protein
MLIAERVMATEHGAAKAWEHTFKQATAEIGAVHKSLERLVATNDLDIPDTRDTRDENVSRKIEYRNKIMSQSDNWLSVNRSAKADVSPWHGISAVKAGKTNTSCEWK